MSDRERFERPEVELRGRRRPGGVIVTDRKGDTYVARLGDNVDVVDGVIDAANPPGGSDTQVQFNDGGALAGDSGLVFNKTTDLLTVGGDLAFGAAGNAVVRRTTADGSDSGNIEFNGGGGAGNARGGRLLVYGNEASEPGGVVLMPGNVGSSRILLYRKDGTAAVIIDGATGTLDLQYGQVKFPATQNASSDANTFDDYEEGTWTPSLGGSATYTDRWGNYTKAGRLVTVEGFINVNAIGTGSTGQITGLPFASTDGAGHSVMAGTAGFFQGLAGNHVFVSCYINGTTVTFVGLTAAGVTTTNPAVIFASGTQLYFQVTYSAAT